jgi:hypothetical protein
MWNAATCTLGLFLSLLLLEDASGNDIATDWRCYRRGEDIRIRYSSVSPTTQDWIGIYKLDDVASPSSDQRQAVVWKWACGKDPCENIDIISFHFDSKSLDAGQYFAYLHDGGNDKHRSSVSSKPFNIREITNEEPCNYGDAVYVQGTSHAIEDTLVVAFENASPEERDWIGIYPLGNQKVGREALVALPTLWQYACGDRECRGKVDHDKLTFDTWSLQEGEYKAVLGRWSADGLYVQKAETEVFAVRPNIQNKCESSIFTKQSCYDNQDHDIIVSFGSSCKPPQAADQVALYPADIDPTNGLMIGSPLIPQILIHCEDQDCSTGSGSVSTPVVEDDASSFQYGQYKAVWWRSNRGGLPRAVESEPFEIRESCAEQSFHLRASSSTV